MIGVCLISVDEPIQGLQSSPRIRRSQICPEMFPTEKTKTHWSWTDRCASLPHLNDDRWISSQFFAKPAISNPNRPLQKYLRETFTKIENHNLKFNLTHLRDKTSFIGEFWRFQNNFMVWMSLREPFAVEWLRRVAVLGERRTQECSWAQRSYPGYPVVGCKMVEKEYRNSAKQSFDLSLATFSTWHGISKRILTVDRKTQALVSTKPVKWNHSETIGRIIKTWTMAKSFAYADILIPTFVSRRKVEAYIFSNRLAKALNILLIELSYVCSYQSFLFDMLYPIPLQNQTLSI